GRHRQRAARALGYAEAVADDVRGAGPDPPYVDERVEVVGDARVEARPVAPEPVRAVELGRGIDLAGLRVELAARVERVAVADLRLEVEPHFVAVHRAAGEAMADAHVAHDHVGLDDLAGLDRGLRLRGGDERAPAGELDRRDVDAARGLQELGG